MKNLKLLLIAAVVLAFGSAFSTVESAICYYVKIDGTYQIQGDGICRSAVTTCEYTIIDPCGSMTDDDNFTPHSSGRWTPLIPPKKQN